MAFIRALRLACRGLARSPGLALTLILTIALGAGGNAALYAFIGGLAERQRLAADSEAAERFAQTASLLGWMSLLVLILACASTTGLLLARATARVRDTAVRIALGASRTSVVLLNVADVIVVLVVGGACAALVAWWTTRLFPMLFYVEDADQLAMRADPGRMLFAGGVALAALLVAGFVPALFARHRDPFVVLRREGPGLSGSLQRLRSRLVASQAAGCTLLVVLAVVVRIDLDRSLRTARGAGVADLAVVRVAVQPSLAWSRPDLGRAFFAGVERRAVEIVGPDAVAWMSTLPGSRTLRAEYRVERPAPYTRELQLEVRVLDPDDAPADLTPVAGRRFYATDTAQSCLVGILNETAAEREFDGDPVGRQIEASDGRRVLIVGVMKEDAGDRPRTPAVFFYENQVPTPAAMVRTPMFAKPRMPDTDAADSGPLATIAVSPSYFDLLDDPVTAGRVFDERDAAGACGVAVISEAGARQAFGGAEAAIGGALIGAGGGRVDIVGVARAAPLGLEQRPDTPWLFRPFDQAYSPRAALIARADGSSGRAFDRLDEAVAGLPNGAAVEGAASLRAFLLRTALAPERIASALVGVCAAFALILTIAGLQGAMSDYVARRRRELAVRLAMGAGAARLAGTVLGEGMRLVVIGALVGLAAAVVVVPLAGLFTAAVWLSVIAIATALGIALAVVVALVAIACVVPVLRAIAVDPKSLLQEG